MDGKELLYRLRQELLESTNSSFMDDKTSYGYLWEAATEFNDRTQILTAEQSITTVADQAGYTLNADFMRTYMRNDSGELFLKYYDTSNYSFPIWRDYEDVYFDNNTSSIAAPHEWTLLDDTLDSQVTGTATSTAAASGGTATLTDTNADFSDVSAGDWIHNTTDGSDGIVVSKTSSTVLVCALFGGTANDWTSADAYVIQPQGRMKVILNPPPSTAGHTLTVPYVQRPAPVFSSYGIYRFPSRFMTAVVKYAVFLYKYRDSEPNFGDALYQYFDSMVRKAVSSTGKTYNRSKLRVNLRGTR